MLSTWLLSPQALKVDSPKVHVSAPTLGRSIQHQAREQHLDLQLSLCMLSTWLLSPHRLKVYNPRSMPRRQHLGLRSIDSRNHNEVSTKLGHKNCIYNYRYACCRHGCSVPNALKLTLPKQGPCHCANTGTCELSTPATSMRSAPSSVALLGLKLLLRMMSTWLLSPQ